MLFSLCRPVHLIKGGITENVSTDVLCANANGARNLINQKPTPGRERVGGDGLEEIRKTINDAHEATTCSVRQIYDHDEERLRYDIL